MSRRLHTIILPVFALAFLQLGSCGRQEISPPPPGGVYRSTSAGASFEQSVQVRNLPGEYVASFNLGDIFRAPFDPNVIMIAAHEQGIIRSFDGGENWEIITTPLVSVVDALSLASGVLVASGLDSDGQGFVIRSLDNGVSWQSVYTVPRPTAEERPGFRVFPDPEPPALFLMDLELDPFNPDRLYAASNLGAVIVGEQSAKVWRTLYTFRSGSTYGISNYSAISVRQLIPSPHQPGQLLIVTSEKTLVQVGPAGLTELEIPSNLSFPPTEEKDSYGTKEVLSASFVAEFPNAIIVGVAGGVVVSRDGGLNWLALSIPIDEGQEFQHIVVSVSPTNINRILVAVGHVFYRSEDGGNSWNVHSLGLPAFSVRDISINPQNASHVLAVVQPES